MSKKILQKSSMSDKGTKALAVPTKKELKKYTPEEAKKLVLQAFYAEGTDLGRQLRELGNDILPKLLHGSEAEQKAVRKTMNEKVTPVMMALEADSHWGLMKAVDETYWGMARELSSQIIKEYSCETHAEKMLAEVVVNAFVQVLKASGKITGGSVEPGGSITDSRTKYIAVLSKQLDRANRQFLASLMVLKQLKAPTIEMNIKANTAFVAQNQQINAPQQGHETNEPK